MASGARVEVFRDKAGKWRWHRKAGNNRTVAGNGEGVDNYADAFNPAQTEASAYGVELVVKRDEGFADTEVA